MRPWVLTCRRTTSLTNKLFKKITQVESIHFNKRRDYTCPSSNEDEECKPPERAARSCQKKCPNEIMDPKHKVALITGGTSGIGFHAADELLRNEACHVIISGIDRCAGEIASKKLNSNYGCDKCTYIHLNVISSEDFQKVFDFATEKFGSIDILFNNAGILEDKKWELEVETNLKSMIRSNIIGLHYMSNYEEKMPRIIINSSDVCALGALPPAPVYTATSYGVLGVTKCFGSKYHYNETGVRVVALCCGPTRTDFVKNANKNQMTEKWSQDTFDMITSKPLQKPDVVGRAVVHLIRFAKSNTIWTVEDSHLYRTRLPKISTVNSMITKL